MIYLFLINLLLLGLLIYRDVMFSRERADLMLRINTTPKEYVEVKKALAESEEEEKAEEEIPLSDLDNDKFQEVINKQINGESN